MDTQTLVSTLKEELQCSICCEVMVGATSLSCSHTFCRYCITEWVQRNPTCPTCRSAFDSKLISMKLIENMIEKMCSVDESIKQQREERMHLVSDSIPSEYDISSICVEHALSNRSHCRSCSLLIDKDSLRFRAERKHRVLDNLKYVEFYHLLCLPSVTRELFVSNIEKVKGYSSLNYFRKRELLLKWKKTYTERTVILIDE